MPTEKRESLNNGGARLFAHMDPSADGRSFTGDGLAHISGAPGDDVRPSHQLGSPAYR